MEVPGQALVYHRGDLPPVEHDTQPAHHLASMLVPHEGRFGVTRLAVHRYAFKIPSIRSNALSAP